ncbi:MAG: hypothetical protein KBS66_07975, partial [Eubacterium sp.]|nr:hypothetical protein [Candidatus Colimonas fimequi]
ATLSVEKKWLKKIGEAANDVGRKGAVKYTITLQENLVVNGDYTLSDTLGAGAEYYDPNMTNKRSVTITRSGDNNFKVIVPLRSGEPTINADGSKTYTNTVTSGDSTFTLKLTEDKPDGTSSFELNVPQNDGKTYTVTYYAAPTGNIAIGDIGNGAGYGPGGPTTPHYVYIETEVSDSVFIEKTNTGLDEGTSTLSWKTTITHDVKADTTLTDTINNSHNGKSEFTDDQINGVVVKQGNTVFKKDDDYTVTKNSETSFTVTFKKTIKASDSNPITVECESVAKDLDKVNEGDSRKFANDAKLVYDQLEATDGAEKTYTKRTHLSKEAGDVSIEDGKAYMTWYVKVNQENDMQGDAIVTDVLTADQKFVSAEKDNSRSGANAKDTTISASSKVNADGRDEVTIDIKGLNNEDNSMLVIALKTQVVDPKKLAKTGTVKLENDADVKWDGGNASAHAEKEVTNRVIDKTSSYSSSTAPFIEYSVVLNENALDLNPGGDTITVVDEFDPRLDFKRATFKLTKADGTEISPEDYNLAVDKANSQFQFVIPDGQKINVEYKCVPSGNLGQTYSPKAFNKMSFFGIDESKINQETDITITEGGGDISLVKSFSIYKYTEKGNRLPGAKFELASVTVDGDGNLKFTTEETKATEDNGVAKFYGKGGKNKGLEENQVYAYREIEAPAGYFITPENAEYKFFAFNSKALTDEFKAAFAKEYPEVDVTKAVRINNSSSYTTDVENTKGKITVEKAFSNAPAPDGTYYFGLFNTATETKATKVGNIVFHDGKAMNTLVFDELEFGVNGAARTYYVYECDANGGKLTPDAQGRITINGNKFEVSGDGVVVVEGTEEGYANTITITNAAEVSCPIDGTKALTGKDLEKDKFRFALLGVEGTDTEGVNVETTNTADGKISFGEFTYTKAGEYKYTVHEVKGNDDTITYDETLYNVTVTVAINKGKMTATPSYKKVVDGVETDADAIAFVNEYNPKSTTWTPEATKTLTGADLEKAQFTFELKGKEGTNTADVDVTAQNAADGSVTFEALKYDKVGTYAYTITETAKNGDYVYDTKTYDVIVTVVDNNGQLKASAEYQLAGTKVNGAAFTNKVKPTEYVFEAEKI